MSGICDTCRRKPCPAEGEGLKRCGFYEGGESNYEKLFGTPERAARTLVDISERANFDGIGGDYDALLEWLRGDAE